jgi:Ca2+-binding RTX toxin-like protein
LGSVIYVSPVEATVDRPLTRGVSAQARPSLTSVSWAPDGETLVYLADGECPDLLGLYRISTGGGQRQRLTHPCRITGTPHADRLTGTPHTDAIYGEAGDDRITSGPAPDFIQGGSGNDVIAGGPGDDRLYGGPGSDRISGGPGWDFISARDGRRDFVACGPGNDAVSADRLDLIAPDCELTERA